MATTLSTHNKIDNQVPEISKAPHASHQHTTFYSALTQLVLQQKRQRSRTGK